MFQRLRTQLFAVILFGVSILAFSNHCSIAASYSPLDKELYYRALEDMKNANQDDVCTRLLAIVTDWDELNWEILKGGELQWEGEPGNSRLLVVAFMSRSSYESYYKEHMENNRSEDYTLQKSLWVTVVPELQNFFIPDDRPYGSQQLPVGNCPPAPKRVVQLLGLNPAFDYDVLVEMWVDPNDLFRPSADPEINDHEAELTYKDAYGNLVFPPETNPFIKYDDSALYMESAWGQPTTYKSWFSNRIATIYDVPDFGDVSTWGYPWSALGYTYDWGKPGYHFGLSEFVIRLAPENNGEVKVKLVRAIDSATPEWNYYFNCWSQ